MKNHLKNEWPLLLVLVAPFAFLASVWPQIPERFPIHFNASFVADGWMPKSAGALLLPVANAFVMLFVRVWFRFDRKMAQSSPETRAHVERVLRQCLTAFALFLSCMSIATVWAAWGQFDPLVRCTLYGLPLILVVLGNAMGKLRPNHTIGIRLPWTLASTAVWNRTHRFGGRLLVGTGLALLALPALGLGSEKFFLALVVALGLWAAVVTAYAFAQSRPETPAATPSNGPAR